MATRGMLLKAADVAGLSDGEVTKLLRRHGVNAQHATAKRIWREVAVERERVAAKRRRSESPPFAESPEPTDEPNKRTGTEGGSAVSAPGAAAVPMRVKQEADGGWPSEFQALRQKPFDQADYDRLHAWFFTQYDIHAGSRESRTRRGTLRSTVRVVGQTVRIAEWPRLQETVERLMIAGDETERQEALGQMRCLERYLQKVRHVTIPRIMRVTSSGGPVGRAAAGDVMEAPIELLESSDEEEVAAAEAIDVEVVILGPVTARVGVKAEPGVH